MSRLLAFLMSAFFVLSCNEKEKPLPVVDSLDISRYMGTWYEIARLPNSFEKGLQNISATYTLRDDGKVSVLNQGYDEMGKLKKANGIAKVPDKAEPAKLKVSFFRPFYGKYWVMALDPEYQYALVGHPNRQYLWFLSREPNLSDEIFQKLAVQAAQQGFDTSRLERVVHTTGQ